MFTSIVDLSNTNLGKFTSFGSTSINTIMLLLKRLPGIIASLAVPIIVKSFTSNVLLLLNLFAYCHLMFFGENLFNPKISIVKSPNLSDVISISFFPPKLSKLYIKPFVVNLILNSFNKVAFK